MWFGLYGEYRLLRLCLRLSSLIASSGNRNADLWDESLRFASNHGADGVEAGVETHHFALDAFGVGVVHGVLERGLAVAVFVRGAARELGFVRPPESTERATTENGAERRAEFPSKPDSEARCTVHQTAHTDPVCLVGDAHVCTKSFSVVVLKDCFFFILSKWWKLSHHQNIIVFSGPKHRNPLKPYEICIRKYQGSNILRLKKNAEWQKKSIENHRCRNL